jgi:hypothetical protein
MFTPLPVVAPEATSSVAPGLVVPIPTVPPYPLFGITIKFPDIEAWVWLPIIPVKAKSAEAVVEPPSSKSSPILRGESAPVNSCQKLVPPPGQVPHAGIYVAEGPDKRHWLPVEVTAEVTRPVVIAA